MRCSSAPARKSLDETSRERRAGQERRERPYSKLAKRTGAAEDADRRRLAAGGAQDDFRVGALLMLDPELERKNMLLGWALFAVFLALFGGVVLVALIYLAVS